MGYKLAGYKVLACVEFLKHLAKIYRLNNPNTRLIEADIRLILVFFGELEDVSAMDYNNHTTYDSYIDRKIISGAILRENFFTAAEFI